MISSYICKHFWSSCLARCQLISLKSFLIVFCIFIRLNFPVFSFVRAKQVFQVSWTMITSGCKFLVYIFIPIYPAHMPCSALKYRSSFRLSVRCVRLSQEVNVTNVWVSTWLSQTRYPGTTALWPAVFPISWYYVLYCSILWQVFFHYVSKVLIIRDLSSLYW